MNLYKLFKIQAKLDEKIVKEKGLEGQDLLDKKILALQARKAKQWILSERSEHRIVGNEIGTADKKP